MGYYLTPGDLDKAGGVPSLDSSGVLPVARIPTLGATSIPTLTGGTPASGSTAIQYRRGTALAWWTSNPTLAAGERGYETDTGMSKVGDGSTAWVALPYVATVWTQQTVPTGGNGVLVGASSGATSGTAAGQAHVTGMGMATRFTSAASTSAQAYAYMNRTVRTGSAGEQGAGWVLFGRFSFNDASYNNTGASTGSRIFVGMSDAALATIGGADAPQGNSIGFYRRNVNGGATDTNWQIFGKSGSSAQDTGMAFAVAKVYEFWIVVTPGGTTADWRIRNVTDATVASGTYSGTMPGTTTSIGPRAALTTVDATARSMDLGILASLTPSSPW